MDWPRLICSCQIKRTQKFYQSYFECGPWKKDEQVLRVLDRREQFPREREGETRGVFLKSHATTPTGAPPQTPWV